MFELGLYRDQNIWKLQLIRIEVGENNSDRVIDLVFYKNHYALV